MRSEYRGGANWWALQSHPWFRYGSRYARAWKARKVAAGEGGRNQ